MKTNFILFFVLFVQMPFQIACEQSESAQINSNSESKKKGIPANREAKINDTETNPAINQTEKVLIEWIIDEFKKDKGVDLSTDERAVQRITKAAKKANFELSTSKETEINLPFICMPNAPKNKPMHLVMKLIRSKLEQIVEASKEEG